MAPYSLHLIRWHLIRHLIRRRFLRPSDSSFVCGRSPGLGRVSSEKARQDRLRSCRPPLRPSEAILRLDSHSPRGSERPEAVWSAGEAFPSTRCMALYWQRRPGCARILGELRSTFAIRRSPVTPITSLSPISVIPGCPPIACRVVSVARPTAGAAESGGNQIVDPGAGELRPTETETERCRIRPRQIKLSYSYQER